MRVVLESLFSYLWMMPLLIFHPLWPFSLYLQIKKGWFLNSMSSIPITLLALLNQLLTPSNPPSLLRPWVLEASHSTFRVSMALLPSTPALCRPQLRRPSLIRTLLPFLGFPRFSCRGRYLAGIQLSLPSLLKVLLRRMMMRCHQRIRRDWMDSPRTYRHRRGFAKVCGLMVVVVVAVPCPLLLFFAV